MEHHTDRRVILTQDPEFKNLYEWSLQEVDADGNKIGRDQIPWHWGLYFTASELVLSDAIVLKPDYQLGSEGEKIIARETQHIRAKLHPEQRRYREPSYSMFGTDRIISSFELSIVKLDEGDEQERCHVWGSVSYTAEVDFSNETTDDCIIFYLHVRPKTFARYAEKIATSAVDEAVLRMSGVAGFYSDWSPSISTDEIKVLTKGEEHKVAIPTDCEIDPPRLGDVLEAEFHLRRVSKLERARVETEETGDWTGHEQIPEERNDRVGQGQPIQRAAVADVRAVSLLSSVRVAVWIVAGLLLLVLIT